MATAAGTQIGKKVPPDRRARLLCGSLEPLLLPWWPDEVESSGIAAGYAEDPRPGLTPVLSRSSDPLASVRLPFTLTGPTGKESVQRDLDLVEKYAKAKPVVLLMFGSRNRGHWRIVDGSYVEKAWISGGDPCEADVTLTLRQASDAAIPIGPVPKR